MTVRQPQDALCFVRNNHLELRLRVLSDVELEVSQGRQTLNRLLLKSELQAARARLGMTAASPRPPSTLDRDGETPPLTAATYSASDRAELEREMHGIRQEVHSLVGRVIPWEGVATPRWHTDHGTTALVVTLALWGVFIAGVMSLVAGYLIHRRAVDRERQRRRAPAASIRQARSELTSATPTRHGARHGKPFGDRHESWQPVSRLRRLWVSHNTQRLVLVQGSSSTGDATPEHAAVHTQIVARVSQTQIAAPTEFVEALANLRRGLMRLQRRLPPSTIPQQPPAHRRPP